MTNQEILAAWMEILAKQSAPLYDFGWNLEHVTEPRDYKFRGTK